MPESNLEFRGFGAFIDLSKRVFIRDHDDTYMYAGAWIDRTHELAYRGPHIATRLNFALLHFQHVTFIQATSSKALLYHKDMVI